MTNTAKTLEINASQTRLGARIKTLLASSGYDQATGKSDWIDYTGATLPGGLQVSHNGDAVFRAGSWLRKNHIVRSHYANGAQRIDHPIHGSSWIGGHGDVKVAVRLEGLATAIETCAAWRVLVAAGNNDRPTALFAQAEANDHTRDPRPAAGKPADTGSLPFDLFRAWITASMHAMRLA